MGYFTFLILLVVLIIAITICVYLYSILQLCKEALKIYIRKNSPQGN